MRLWCEWWRWCAPLRGACARKRTFLWMGVVLVGFCVREDLWGVTSLVRALGLQAVCYDRLLDFFHSPALNVEGLTRLWAARPGGRRTQGRQGRQEDARRQAVASAVRIEHQARIYPGPFVPGGGHPG